MIKGMNWIIWNSFLAKAEIKIPRQTARTPINIWKTKFARVSREIYFQDIYRIEKENQSLQHGKKQKTQQYPITMSRRETGEAISLSRVPCERSAGN